MISQPTTTTELTAREYEILQHVAVGRSNADIGRQLGISSYTVRNHLYKIFEKVGANSRWHAVTLVFHQRRLSDIFDSINGPAEWAPDAQASPVYAEHVA